MPINLHVFLFLFFHYLKRRKEEKKKSFKKKKRRNLKRRKEEKKKSNIMPSHGKKSIRKQHDEIASECRKQIREIKARWAKTVETVENEARVACERKNSRRRATRKMAREHHVREQYNNEELADADSLRGIENLSGDTKTKEMAKLLLLSFHEQALLLLTREQDFVTFKKRHAAEVAYLSECLGHSQK